MTWLRFCRVALLSLPLLLGPYQPAPIAYLGALSAAQDGRPTLPCTIGTIATTCVIDTGAAVALAVPQGLAEAAGGTLEPFAEDVTGISGGTTAAVYGVALGMAGERQQVWAVAVPGYEGPPLVGVPGIRALRAVVVVDGGTGESWFVVER